MSKISRKERIILTGAAIFYLVFVSVMGMLWLIAGSNIDWRRLVGVLFVIAGCVGLIGIGRAIAVGKITVKLYKGPRVAFDRIHQSGDFYFQVTWLTVLAAGSLTAGILIIRYLSGLGT